MRECAAGDEVKAGKTGQLESTRGNRREDIFISGRLLQGGRGSRSGELEGRTWPGRCEQIWRQRLRAMQGAGDERESG